MWSKPRRRPERSSPGPGIGNSWRLPTAGPTALVAGEFQFHRFQASEMKLGCSLVQRGLGRPSTKCWHSGPWLF
eukprot:3014434-Alexandrium_andersonii.AAC.1